MRLQEARGFVMQALKTTDLSQVTSLVMAVGMLKAKSETLDTSHAFDGRQFLKRGDESVILEVIWSLIIQGILMPGMNDANPYWPFLRLTEYGKKCVAEDRLLPYDPDGYLEEFNKSVPLADSVIVEYLTESLQCYIHGLNRSSAVMLGGASEKAVLLLFEGYADSIVDSSKKAHFKSELQKQTSIFRKFEAFDKHFSTTKSTLPKPLAENIDSLLRGVFDLIRATRNDAGHRPALHL